MPVSGAFSFILFNVWGAPLLDITISGTKLVGNWVFCHIFVFRLISVAAILNLEGKLVTLGYMFIYQICSFCNYLQFKPNFKSQLQSWPNLYSKPRACGRHFEKRLKNALLMRGFLGGFFWWLSGPQGPQIHFNRFSWNYFTEICSLTPVWISTELVMSGLTFITISLWGSTISVLNATWFRLGGCNESVLSSLPNSLQIHYIGDSVVTLHYQIITWIVTPFTDSLPIH